MSERWLIARDCVYALLFVGVVAFIGVKAWTAMTGCAVFENPCYPHAFSRRK